MRQIPRLLIGLGLLGLAHATIPIFPAVTPATAQQAAAKNYVIGDLDSDAIRLEETLRKRAASIASSRTADDLRREAGQLLQRNDFAGALNALGAALSRAPNDAALWLSYARAAATLAQRDNNRRWQLQEESRAAAYRSYQRATTATGEAAALNYLASLYADQSSHRLALNTYRQSLSLVDNPEIRKVYESLRERYGFRILDYKVESDLATPRVCFQFSESLKARTEFTPFVAVSGNANGAITNEDRQLCVEGLRHGERYSIVVRQGLPSSVDEQLLRSSDYVIYVKDRSPQARFTGKNYVLPRVGQEGIPIVSTNTPKIALDVVRIGDRGLLPAVRSDDFLAQVSSYRLKDLFENKGVKVWTGTLDVKSELNRDVVTAFPVLEALKKLEPGVYVMVSMPGEKAPSQIMDDNDDSYDNLSTQWFVVSDIGLTSFSGDDGVHILARSLASAGPIAGLEVRLVARNNEILGTARTDANGYAKFDPGLSRGTGGLAPGLITASDASGDYSFLDLAQSAFDLTDRGVRGRPAARALDALVYAERGVYRSGETVNISALLRDPRGNSVETVPLTLVVRRPDGVEYRRAAVGDQGLGGRAWSVNLLPSVKSGTWRVSAFADPKSPAIGETTFLVEDYLPERLDVTITPESRQVQPGTTVSIDTTARFLYGAPGSDLEINGELVIQATKQLNLPGLEGYVAGLEDQEFETIKTDIETSENTDEAGKAKVEVEIPDVDTTRPLEAKFIIRVAEAGGRAVERTVTLPVRPNKSLIALRKNFEELREDSNATFNVIALNAEGNRVAARGLRWTLSRVTNNYQWYNSDGRWSFERVKSTRRVSEGTVDATTQGVATITAPVGWGAYRLDVVSSDGSLAPVSSSFNVGWSGDASADTPDLLEVNLDKKGYNAGEALKLRVNSRFEGKATIAIVGDQLRELVLADLKTGDNNIDIPVKAEWGASAYAVVLAHRPLDQQARRMPGRALGLAWFAVEADQRKLEVSMPVPEKVEPRKPFTIPVEIKGLTPGEDAYITLAAVDVGILNLTRYKTPDPTNHFFGQRQLGSEIRDLYGLLIDGMQGTRGAIRSGGDAAGLGVEGNRPTQEPMARYSGVVKVGPDGRAQVTFELPAFNGTLRLAAVAWSKSRVGSAEKDVFVRDPVVVQATLPRFLNFGDRSQFHMQIDNVDGGAGQYVLDVDIRGPVTIAAEALRRTVTLAAKQRTEFTIPVTAAGIGRAELSLRITGPNLDATQNFALNVQSGSPEIYRRTVRDLPAGQSITISNDLVADYLPGTGSISIAASPLGAIDVPALLQALDRYPYGCTEQTVSRALPLLYVNQLATANLLSLDGDLRQRVQVAIDKVLSRQDASGSFGLWSSESSNDLWLDAFVTDFLTRAREGNYEIPQRSFDQALDRLRNQVVNASDVSSANSGPIAYAIYVLARNGRPIMGDLRYLADTKIEAFTNPLARAQLGAALALLGDRGRATAAFEAASRLLVASQRTRFSRSDYGSLLRDSAGMLALAAETNAGDAVLTRAAMTVQTERGVTRFTSTQENTWMVLAATAMTKQAQNMALTIDGQPHKGAYFRTWRGFALDGREVRIGNEGQTQAQVVITTAGQPSVKEPAESQGYQVERNYFTLDGKPANLASIKQNERLVVTLKVTELEAAYARLLLVDQLPAGLEIDNPRLVDSGSIEALEWLKSDVSPEHTEYKDDRFVAAFEREGRQKAVFYAAYIVRAVTPGQYVLPPASIEDMYRPERFGRTAFGNVTITSAK
jgi:uncharacterized protein YfaS (alpha-2-macroglobulin family)